MKKSLKFLKCFSAVAVAVCAGVGAFLTLHPTFGGKPDAESLAKIRASSAFDGTRFVNLEPTMNMTVKEREDFSVWDWVLNVVNPPPNKQPSEPLPTLALDVSQLQNGSLAWFGHSTVLFQTDNQRFLIDPVFYRASPVPLTGKPFAMTHTPTIDELPPIDAVLISHDHYDHLDYNAIRELDSKTQHFYVPLGVKAHLQRWGIADSKITEMDWHEQVKQGNATITLVPSRHFSGRTWGADSPTLWGGYVVKSPDLSLYFSGDSGYGTHFAKHIAQYAPFDVVLMENGAYNKQWALIHQQPEESFQAAKDVKATLLVPIHWAKFDLAYHTWKEPIERLLNSNTPPQMQIATPKIGQVFHFSQPPTEKWWESVK